MSRTGWRVGTLESVFGNDYTVATGAPPLPMSTPMCAPLPIHRWRCGEGHVQAWPVAHDLYALHATCEHAVHQEMARYPQLRITDVAIVRENQTAPEAADRELRLPVDARGHHFQFRLSNGEFTVPVIVRVEIAPDPSTQWHDVVEIHAGEYLGHGQIYLPLLYGTAEHAREISIHVREATPRPGEGRRPDSNADGVCLWKAMVPVS